MSISLFLEAFTFKQETRYVNLSFSRSFYIYNYVDIQYIWYAFFFSVSNVLLFFFSYFSFRKKKKTIQWEGAPPFGILYVTLPLFLHKKLFRGLDPFNHMTTTLQLC